MIPLLKRSARNHEAQSGVKTFDAYAAVLPSRQSPSFPCDKGCMLRELIIEWDRKDFFFVVLVFMFVPSRAVKSEDYL